MKNIINFYGHSEITEQYKLHPSEAKRSVIITGSIKIGRKYITSKGIVTLVTTADERNNSQEVFFQHNFTAKKVLVENATAIIPEIKYAAGSVPVVWSLTAALENLKLEVDGVQELQKTENRHRFLIENIQINTNGINKLQAAEIKSSQKMAHI